MPLSLSLCRISLSSIGTGLGGISGGNSPSFSFSWLNHCGTNLVSESLFIQWAAVLSEGEVNAFKRPLLSEMCLLSCFFLNLPVFYMGCELFALSESGKDTRYWAWTL